MPIEHARALVRATPRVVSVLTVNPTHRLGATRTPCAQMTTNVQRAMPRVGGALGRRAHGARRAMLLGSLLMATACSKAPTGLGPPNKKTPGPPAFVVVRPGTENLAIGQTMQFVDTVTDANGHVLSGQTVVWGSANTAIATISGTGMLTAVAVGQDTIEAVVGGITGQAVLTVVAAALDHIAVTPNPAIVQVNQTTALTATAEDAHNTALSGYAFIWTTKAAGIATVSSSGVVTGIAAGTDTIVASSGSFSGIAVVTVQTAAVTPVASVAVTPAVDTVKTGAAAQLTATLKDASGNVLTGRKVDWSSGNPAIATVDIHGRVTAVTGGSTTIQAKSGSASGTATIVVPVNTTPVSEVFIFDKDSLVPFGVAYDISKHVRWVLKNSAGDSVGATTLATASAVAYVPTLGSLTPGTCVITTGTFQAICPDGGSPTTGASLTANGYWSVTVHPQPVKGIPAQPNMVRWYVNSTLSGSRPLHITAKPSALTTVRAGTAVDVTRADAFLVQTAGGQTVATLPIGGIAGEVFADTTIPPGALGTPNTTAGCTVHGLAITGPEYLGAGPPDGSPPNDLFPYSVVVTTKPATFNGVSNPQVTGITNVIRVIEPPPPTVTMTPALDTVAIGDSVQIVVDTLGADGKQIHIPNANVDWASAGGPAPNANGWFVATAIGTVNLIPGVIPASGHGVSVCPGCALVNFVNENWTTDTIVVTSPNVPASPARPHVMSMRRSAPMTAVQRQALLAARLRRAGVSGARSQKP
jgi:uncharacterized protein YjdB